MVSLDFALRVDEPEIEKIIHISDSTVPTELFFHLKEVLSIECYLISWTNSTGESGIIRKEYLDQPLSKLNIPNQSTIIFTCPNSMKESKVYSMIERIVGVEESESEGEDVDIDTVLQNWLENKTNKTACSDLVRHFHIIGSSDAFRNLNKDDILSILRMRIKKVSDAEMFSFIADWIKEQTKEECEDQEQRRRILFKDIYPELRLNKLTPLQITNYVAPCNLLSPKELLKLFDVAAQNREVKVNATKKNVT